MSQSVSQLRRCSAVSLTVPTTSVFKSNSLPGSSTNVDEEREIKDKFQVLEVRIKKKEILEDERVCRGEHEPAESVTNNISVASLPNNLDTNIIRTCDKDASSVNSASPQQRRKGVSRVSNGPMPSLEPH